MKKMILGKSPPSPLPLEFPPEKFLPINLRPGKLSP